MKIVLCALALSLTAPALAATRTVEVGGTPGQPAIAVASACIENTTNFDIVLHSNWGIGDRDAATVIGAGDEVLYRLVLDQPAAGVELALTYPADSTGATHLTAQLDAPWGTARVDDCTQLARWSLDGATTDGPSGATAFSLTPMTRNP